MELNKISRRDFLKRSAVVGMGLTIGFRLPFAEHRVLAAGSTDSEKSGASPMNAFLTITPDDTITIYVKHLEMGQGVYTGLPMLVAEELACDWSRIRVEGAPADASKFNNLFWGPMQGTGGSTSLANSWRQLREAGAIARELLLSAAAEEWQVGRAELKVEEGAIIHPPTGKRASYGALATAAAKQKRPEKVELKPVKEFRLLGKSLPRTDNKSKTDGTARFGIDMRLPNQVTALVARAPRFGGKVKSVNGKAALKVDGVVEIVQVPSGVAVIAKNFWAAKRGRDALKIEWEETDACKLSTSDLRQQYGALLEKPGKTATAIGEGNLDKLKPKAQTSAVYEFPYLAHAPMEPLNCLIQVQGKSVELWYGCQFQTGDQGTVAGILGVKPESVKINTLFAGGSFGRRANPKSDFVAEAAWIAKNSKLKGRPIQVLWTREDDIRGGYFRPFFMHKVHAGIDEKGKPLFWRHRLVGQSILEGTPFGMMIKDGIDATSVEGVANLAYAVPNLYVDLHSPKVNVPVLWWRSVGHTHTAFAAETMMDELAEMAGQDPVAYRLSLLSDKPRHLAALRLAAEKAEWHKAPATGIGRGVAVHESFNTVVAAIVDVRLDENNSLSVERVVYGVDCGFVVNPDNVRAQLEGGCGFALSAALYGSITLEEGKVVQSNFHDYPSLRLAEMPNVEAHFVASEKDPTGIGEPGVPVIAPALANAIYKLTRKRLRSLPLRV